MMGGRGGTSGIIGGLSEAQIKRRLPSESDKIKLLEESELPELKGSKRQVQWAKELRSEILSYIRGGEQVSIDSPMGEAYKSGKPAMLNYIKNLPRVTDYTVDLAIRNFNEMKNRYQRYNEIASNPSAKFWIDHRFKQERNNLWNRVKGKDLY